MSVWLLPENIADILPREARAIEELRSTFLKLVTTHGFEVVRPPMIEYVDSLLTGAGNDLDLRTFKIVDQASGKTLGIRADMTPQVARIDAHILNREGVTRLCYVASVLHARPLHPLASRQPYVAGVELFGSRSPYSDSEIISLGIDALHRFGLENIYLDIGHTGIVRSILAKDPGTEKHMDTILYALNHKDRTSLEELKGRIQASTINDLIKITTLFGGYDILPEIRKAFPNYPEFEEILKHVEWLAKRSKAEQVTFDFADVHGYQYETGVTFSVNIPGRYQAVLRGGRYEDIGAKFGRNRPAVGFTLYLREIVAVLETRRPYAIVAPQGVDDIALNEKILQLREEGQIVVQMLPEDDIAALEQAYRLDDELICENGIWTVTYRSNIK